jgi:hypothetical protein
VVAVTASTVINQVTVLPTAPRSESLEKVEVEVIALIVISLVTGLLIVRRRRNLEVVEVVVSDMITGGEVGVVAMVMMRELGSVVSFPSCSLHMLMIRVTVVMAVMTALG